MKNHLFGVVLFILSNQVAYAQASTINYNVRLVTLYNAPYLKNTSGLDPGTLNIPSFQGKQGWGAGFSASKQLRDSSKWHVGVDFDILRKNYQLEFKKSTSVIGPLYKQDFISIRPFLGYSINKNIGLDFGPYFLRSIGSEKEENASTSSLPKSNKIVATDYGVSISLNFTFKPINLKLLAQQGLNGSKYIEITDATGNQVGSVGSYQRNYQVQVGYNF